MVRTGMDAAEWGIMGTSEDGARMEQAIPKAAVSI